MSVAATRKRFTVHDYHRMGEAGILGPGDRVELIEGEIVAMSPIGPRHHASVDRANRALVLAVGDDAIVRVGGSVRLDLFSEPEPDLVLLRPRDDFYATRHAGPDDILLIVEIAESSLAFDRTVKTRVYANAGVCEYWLADLQHAAVTRYAEPVDGAWQRITTRGVDEDLAPAALPKCAIAVATLLGRR